MALLLKILFFVEDASDQEQAELHTDVTIEDLDVIILVVGRST